MRFKEPSRELQPPRRRDAGDAVGSSAAGPKPGRISFTPKLGGAILIVMHGRFCFGCTPFHIVILLRRADEGQPRDEYDSMLQAITARRLQFYADQQRSSHVRVRLLKREDLPKAVAADIRCSELYPADALRFSVPMSCEGCEPYLTQVDDERYWVDLSAKGAAAAIERWVRDMFFAVNLAWPGAASLVDGVVRQRGRTLHTFKAEYATVLLDARVTAYQQGWPMFRQLELVPVWTWLRRQPGFCRRFGGGPIGRALNAFSHIARGLHDPAVELMWAMIGIEALFTRGGSALLDQVRERSRLLIGDAPGARRIISRMYEIRSRFVHGDLDFEGEHRRERIENFGESDETSLHETSRIGIAILVAAIQELVARDWSNLEFKTELASA